MALIRCPECGKEISSNAASCPNCGNPVPKKMVPVYIERSRSIAMAVECHVIIDGSMVGDLKCGGSLEIKLPVGTHSVSTESEVRAFGKSSADTRGVSGQQFTINDTDRSVHITIATKGSWTGGVGKCIVKEITKG